MLVLQKKAGNIVYKIAFWAISVFLLFFALIGFTENGGILSGILFLLTAVFVNPLIDDLINDKVFAFPRWIVIIVLIVGFFASIFTYPSGSIRESEPTASIVEINHNV